MLLTDLIRVLIAINRNMVQQNWLSHVQSDRVIGCPHQILFCAKISLNRLHRSVPKQYLDLPERNRFD
jgi:hypothetical protein